MPYNPYNPYNPFQPQPNYGNFVNPYPQGQQPQAQPQANTYAFVNGIEGAKSYPVQPNQAVMLMDSERAVAYMKQANAMGQATIKYFRLVETSESELRDEAAPHNGPDYATKADLSALERKFEELLKASKKAPESGE